MIWVICQLVGLVTLTSLTVHPLLFSTPLYLSTKHPTHLSFHLLIPHTSIPPSTYPLIIHIHPSIPPPCYPSITQSPHPPFIQPHPSTTSALHPSIPPSLLPHPFRPIPYTLSPSPTPHPFIHIPPLHLSLYLLEEIGTEGINRPLEHLLNQRKVCFYKSVKTSSHDIFLSQLFLTHTP